MKKWLGMLLALALALGLAACGSKSAEEAPTGAPAPSESAPPAETPSVPEVAPEGYTPFVPDNETDVVEKLMGYPGSTVLLTVDGVGVTAEEYFYWLGSMASYYNYVFGIYYYQNLDLNSEFSPGVTWGEQIKTFSRQNVVLTALGPKVAARYGVSLTDEDIQDLYDEREGKITGSGGEAMYIYQLQGMGISDRALFAVEKGTRLYEKASDAYTALILSGEGEDAITREEMEAYLAQEDLLRAKHILLLTKDMATGTEMSDEEKAAQRAIIEDIADQLAAAEDPIALFDQLMFQYSEDTGLAANPDGYLFTGGQMVSEFENGTRALEVGGISPIIQSSYGYHIILRLDADCDETREKVAAQKFNDMMDAMSEAADVVTTPEYEAIDTAVYYEALVNYQNSLAQPSAEPTLEPYEGGGETPAG